MRAASCGPRRRAGRGRLAGRGGRQITLKPLEIAPDGATHLRDIASRVAQQLRHVAAQVAHAGSDVAANRGEVALGDVEHLLDLLEPLNVSLGPLRVVGVGRARRVGVRVADMRPPFGRESLTFTVRLQP